jgi:hypothetical protein
VIPLFLILLVFKVSLPGSIVEAEQRVHRDDLRESGKDDVPAEQTRIDATPPALGSPDPFLD